MSVESDAAAFARGRRAFLSSPTRKREAARKYEASLGGTGRATGGSVRKSTRKRSTRRRTRR